MNKSASITIDAHQVASLVEEHLASLAYTLRPDYRAALEAALPLETSERGRAVLEQLIANARLAETEGLPLCQDTGYVWVCLEVSGPVYVPADVFSGVDAAVARAYKAAGLRMSMVQDALADRTNTATNTPAFCEVLAQRDGAAVGQRDGAAVGQRDGAGAPVLPKGKTGAPAPSLCPTAAPSLCPTATLHIMLKGGGSDNASALTMLPPGADVEGVLDFVTQAVADKGANACPPLVIGVGAGGSFDSVASLAKHALLRPVGSLHPNSEIAALEEELLARINALNIGPGGLGGSTTALAVHIASAPSHIASLPVAVNIGCTAQRSISINL